MQNLALNGYSKEDVIRALHSPSRTLSFHYELLDKNNQLKKPLANVLGASVSNNTFAKIKRTATFTLKEDAEINFLSDRIKPYIRLKMPDGNFIEWPQGVFLLSTPPRETDSSGMITRKVKAYDQLQILVNDKVDTRYTVTAGTNYIGTVRTLLDSSGLTQQNLTATDKVLPADRDWEIGTPKLNIISELLGAINYKSLWFDENGLAVAQPYVSPQSRASEYTYQDDRLSIIFPEVEQELDLFTVPNKWIRVVSQPDMAPLVSTYTNSNPDSSTSTENRGFTIVDYDEVEAADQASLDAITLRAAFEASQVYEQVSFSSGIMPIHSENDILTLVFSRLGLSAKYSESSWSLELKAGGKMKHVIRRVVEI